MRALGRLNRWLTVVPPSTIAASAVDITHSVAFPSSICLQSTIRQPYDGDQKADDDAKHRPSKFFVFNKKPQTALDLLEDSLKGVSVSISEEGNANSSLKRLGVPAPQYCSKVICSAVSDPALLDRAFRVATQLTELGVMLSEPTYAALIQPLMHPGKTGDVLDLWQLVLQMYDRNLCGAPPASLLAVFVNCAVQSRHPEVVVGILEAMKKLGLLPRRHSLSSLVQALLDLDVSDAAHAVSDWMVVSGFPPDALLHVSTTAWHPDKQPTIAAERAMTVAWRQFLDLRIWGGQLPPSFCSSFLQACFQAHSLQDAQQLWGHMTQSGGPHSLELYIRMMKICNKAGSAKDGIRVYKQMVQEGVAGNGVLYTELLSALRNHVDEGEPLVHQIWQDMCSVGIRPNGLTLAAAVQANLGAGLVDDALGLIGSWGPSADEPISDLYATLMVMVGKRGHYTAMQKVYKHMKDGGVQLTISTASVLLYCHSLRHPQLHHNWLLLTGRPTQCVVGSPAELDSAEPLPFEGKPAALHLPEEVESACLQEGAGAEQLLTQVLQNEWSTRRGKQFEKIRVTPSSPSPSSSSRSPSRSSSSTLPAAADKAERANDEQVWQYVRRPRYRLIDVLNTVIGGLAGQGCSKAAFVVYFHLLKQDVIPNETTLRYLLLAAVNSPAHHRLHNIITVVQDAWRFRVSGSSGSQGQLFDRRTKSLIMQVAQAEVDSKVVSVSSGRRGGEEGMMQSMRRYDSMLGKIQRLKRLLDDPS